MTAPVNEEVAGTALFHGSVESSTSREQLLAYLKIESL